MTDSASNGRYRGLLVDYGGVLTTNLFESFQAFCEQAGIEPTAVRRVFRQNREARDLLIGLETGRIPEEEFEPRVAGILGVPAEGLIDRLFAGSRPDAAMQTAVMRAREAGIRTGLISNSWGTRRYDRARLGELFDGVVISGEVGIRKPSPEIYTLGAEAIGVEPAACVFVDDLAFNLQPAGQLGMATIHHISTEETMSELEALFGVALR